jgi:hypothetical protein
MLIYLQGYVVMIAQLAALTLLVAILGLYLYFAGKAIEAAEGEYQADPEAWEKRHPEQRELF